MTSVVVVPEDTGSMSITSHLVELRTRLVRTVFWCLLAWGLCLWQWEWIFNWLKAPLEAAIATLPADAMVGTATKQTQGGIIQIFRVATAGALVVASPFVLAEGWGFVAPGLTRKERAFVGPLLPVAALLFFGGCAFAYYIIFPPMATFMVQINAKIADIQPIEIQDYLALITNIMIAMGVAFQIPVLSFLATRLGWISSAKLGGYRRYAIVGSAFLAALITPTPDAFNMFLMALPLYGLYELSVLVAWWNAPLPEGTEVNPGARGGFSKPMKLLTAIIVVVLALLGAWSVTQGWNLTGPDGAGGGTMTSDPKPAPEPSAARRGITLRQFAAAGAPLGVELPPSYSGLNEAALDPAWIYSLDLALTGGEGADWTFNLVAAEGSDVLLLSYPPQLGRASHLVETDTGSLAFRVTPDWTQLGRISVSADTGTEVFTKELVFRTTDLDPDLMEYVEGELLIGLSEGVAPNDPALTQLLAQHDLQLVGDLNRGTALHLRDNAATPRDIWELLDLVIWSPLVTYAEPNFIVQVMESGNMPIIEDN